MSLCQFKTHVTDLLTSDHNISSLTGVPSLFLLKQIYAESKKANENINFEDIVLVLMKLKLNLTFQSLSVLSNISTETSVKIFQTTVPVLHKVLESSIVWHSKDFLLTNMPYCFRAFNKTRIALKSIEVRIKKSKQKNLTELKRAKYLIGISPIGSVAFISKGYGGPVDEKEMTEHTGILKKLTPVKDAVMADECFDIDDLCYDLRIDLIRPVAEEAGHFKETDAVLNLNLAIAKIQIDHTYQRVHDFKIISDKSYSFDLVPYLDCIMVIISALVNLGSFVVDENTFQLNCSR